MSGMVEKRGWGLWLTHVALFAGIVVICYPLYIAFIASTLTQADLVTPPMPLLPGSHFLENYRDALLSGMSTPVWKMMANSLVMALGITAGKIAISLISAYAIVYFFDILLPLSRTNIAALFVILFIYGWNQYLWPLLITTDPKMNTIVMGIKQMLPTGDQTVEWPVIMATAILAMVPPVAVVICMRNLFIKGLIESEK